MSSARAYKAFKRRQMALHSKAPKKSSLKEEGVGGLLKRKSGEKNEPATEDITKVVEEYIKAIRGL